MIFYNLSDFLPLRKQLSDSNIPLIFTNGCFDILHAGHARYLSEAKDLGGVLVVGVNSDVSVRRLKGSSRPINTFENRSYLLSQLVSVDYILPFSDDTPISLIKHLRPDYLVKGGDYANISELVGYDFVTSYGGIVKSLSFYESLSSSLLLKKMND